MRGLINSRKRMRQMFALRVVAMSVDRKVSQEEFDMILYKENHTPCPCGKQWAASVNTSCADDCEKVKRWQDINAFVELGYRSADISEKQVKQLIDLIKHCLPKEETVENKHC